MSLPSLIALCILTTSQADPSGQDVEGQNAAKLKEFAQIAMKEVAGLRVQLPDNERQKISLRETPILKYTNPVSGSMNGNVFIWTSGPRPEIIAAVFQFPGRPLSVECHSLSEQRVELVRDDAVAWHPAGPGIELKAIPKSPKPAETRASRLLQMRALAKQFAAERTDPDGQKLLLRLLPQPVHRYDDGDKKVLDGALFAFVEGTNPDVVLVLENRKGEPGDAWHYGAARLHHRQMQLTLNGEVVWSVRQLANDEKSVPNESYFTFRRQ